MITQGTLDCIILAKIKQSKTFYEASVIGRATLISQGVDFLRTCTTTNSAPEVLRALKEEFLTKGMI